MNDASGRLIPYVHVMASGVHRDYYPCQRLTHGNMGQIQSWPVLMNQGGLRTECQKLPPNPPTTVQPLAYTRRVRASCSRRNFKAFTLTLNPYSYSTRSFTRPPSVVSDGVTHEHILASEYLILLGSVNYIVIHTLPL